MIPLGSSIRLNASFYNEDDELTDAISVAVSIVDGSNVEVESGSATREGLGTYSYDWTPTDEGSYVATFTATFSDAIAVVATEIDVDDESTPATPSTTVFLGDDYEFIVSAGYEPMLADPEYLLPMFGGEVTLVEVSELVYRYSLEVLAWLGSREPGPEAYDYVVAATLCALGRRYSGLMDGISTTGSITLGDLQVQDGSSSSSYVVNRGSASTWCEYAELLRRHIRNSGGGGMTSAVKSGAWSSPLQNRTARLVRTRRGRGCSTNLWDRDICD